jgi:hypothetical protein
MGACHLNADNHFLFIPVPIVTEVRPLQPEKAYSPMLVTLLGIVMEERPLQPEKALSPMLVTLLGIVMEVRPLQPLNILNIDNQ